MPVGTAVHERTLALCESLNIKEWSGYYAVSSYETHHEHEYNALRSGAGLLDVSPLYKYRISGPDAVKLIDRVITRDAAALDVGQVYYTPWCDDHGKVIDDGTVMRLGNELYRWTAADPSLRWFTENAERLRVSIDDVSAETAALALQGPMSAALLRAVLPDDIRPLKYFRVMQTAVGGIPVEVSRTGYTGDLGYEIWIPWERAAEVWDRLMEAGRAFAIRPVGLQALDIARLEAGLLLIDVDFHSSKKALTDTQKYSPFEMGLGRLVRLDKGAFNGKPALAEERRRGSPRKIVGLEISWPAVERLFDVAGMAPQLPAGASRSAVPVYKRGRQVGRATTTGWSPTLKKLIALATIDAPHNADGTELDFEVTVEGTRHQVPATVVKTPFFNPARKTATPRL
jgi:glycine cleavage system T protein (aminomethyltransferase)